MDENVKQRYITRYGPFVRGEYRIGEHVKSRHGSGNVIWSYRYERRLTYVINDGSGFLVKIPASAIVEQPGR